jgi:hypothetical protein
LQRQVWLDFAVGFRAGLEALHSEDYHQAAPTARIALIVEQKRDADEPNGK